MANKDQPRGAVPYGRLRNASKYEAGSEIRAGDFVTMADDGQIDPVAVDGSSYTSNVLGVALSNANSAGDPVLVADDPNQKFIVQADGADIDARTDINLNYAILATAHNSAYKKSQHELDSDTGDTTATLPLKLLEVMPRIDNALGAQVDCIVQINNHKLSGGTGSAGI